VISVPCGWCSVPAVPSPLEQLVVRAGREVQRAVERAASSAGTSATGMAVLAALEECGPLSQRDLAGHVRVSPATLTPVMDALEAAGALTRERDRTDRRVVRASVTPHGRGLRAAAASAVRRAVEQRLPRPEPGPVREFLEAVVTTFADDGLLGPWPGGAGSVPPVPLRGLLMDYSGVLDEDPGMLEMVRRAAAAGIATALVSDAPAVPEETAAAFDLVVLGAALGVRKPDPEIYRIVAERLGVQVTECVVVDDADRNVRGARAAGAVVVHHWSPARTISEVEILLDLPAA
jgi:DNA-binding MarR family transcriptional regulator